MASYGKNLKVLMGVDDMSGDASSDSEECYVMVDDDDGGSDVTTAGGSSAQRIHSRKALEMISNTHREHIKLFESNNDQTVEVVPVEDRKRGIQNNGSSNIEHDSDEDGASLKRPTILRKALQVKYPDESSSEENCSHYSSVETQTERFTGSGPTFNIFFCTFHKDGSAETHCDMPIEEDIQDSTFLRSGKALHANPDQDSIYDESDVPFKKKRAYKRRKRRTSYNEYDDDLNLENSTSDGEIVSESDQSKVNIVIKVEPINYDDEGVTEISKSKGQKKKRRVKKTKRKPLRKRRDIQCARCQFCPEVFPSFCQLERHAKEEHNSKTLSFPCDECDVVFTRPQNLERHKNTKHRDRKKPCVCDLCGREFSRTDALALHFAKVHDKKSLESKPSSKPRGPNTFRCTACDKLFATEQNLKIHRGGNLSCTNCDLTFECKAKLTIHEYNKHPVPCEDCGQVCNSKHALYLHKLSHDPKYICGICEKGFIWKSQFTNHMLTHTGENPEVCDVCGKAFPHKIALGKHKWQTHDNTKKRFKCETCGKCFLYQAKLRNHMRTHTGEKPFLCELCPSMFTERFNLTAHIKSVHGVYTQSVNADGTTEMQLVKYKRKKKESSETQPTEDDEMPESAEPPPPQKAQMVQEQFQMTSESEAEAAVYEIL